MNQIAEAFLGARPFEGPVRDANTPNPRRACAMLIIYIHNTSLGCLHGDIHLRPHRLFWIAPRRHTVEMSCFLIKMNPGTRTICNEKTSVMQTRCRFRSSSQSLYGVEKPKPASRVILMGLMQRACRVHRATSTGLMAQSVQESILHETEQHRLPESH